MNPDNANQDNDLLGRLSRGEPATPVTPQTPPAASSESTAVATPVAAGVSPGPVHREAPAGFEASRPAGGGFNFRILLFLLIVAVPIAGLGFVYARTALSDGTRELADGSLWVDLQKMVSFEFDQRNGRTEDIPAQWRQLDGQRVVLEGEMVPTRSAAGQVRDFQLVWSVAQCCYTGQPQIQHFVNATVADDKRVNVYRQPVRVKGTLTVDARQENGQVVGLWWLDVENVEPIS